MELKFTVDTRPTECPICNKSQTCKHKCLFQCPECKGWRKLKVSSIILRPSRENAHSLCKSCSKKAHNLPSWTRERLSSSARKPGEYTHSDETKAKLSRSYRINEKRGRSKWFKIIRKDFSVIKVQGTWEKWYAEQLIERGIKFDAHDGFIEYISEDGILRKWFYDFYFPDIDEYVDIKSEYTLSKKAEAKFDAIRKLGYSVRVIILTRQGMRDNPSQYFPNND